MLIANVECDEIINQIVTSLSKRQWDIIFYKDGISSEPLSYNKQRNKLQVKKIMKRLKMIEGVDYALQLNIVYPNLSECLVAMHAKLKNIKEKIQCDVMNLWLGPDDGSNFRFKAAKTLPYKGTRGPKPEVLKQLRSYLINIRNAKVIYGYEADDALGINQVIPNEFDKCVGKSPLMGAVDTIAVHCDKDIFMIPGKHYNTLTEEFSDVTELGELKEINGKIKGNGLYFFYYQLLIGDKVDNIPSLKKGLGPKWAHNILEEAKDEKELLDRVIINYKLKLAEDRFDTSWKDRLLEQADLIWICRNEEEIGSQYIQRRCKELFGVEL